MIEVGDKAPSFRLPSTAGRDLTLEEFAGRTVILYFYPKDDTPGCTIEACNFRDNLGRIEAVGAKVLGVSGDSLHSHDHFRAKHGLNFDLVCDPDNALAKTYGAYGEKEINGVRTMGVIRSTYLISGDGLVGKIWSPVRVQGHVDDILATIGAPASAPNPPAPARVKAAAAAAVAAMPAPVQAAAEKVEQVVQKAKARVKAEAPKVKAAVKKAAKKVVKKAIVKKAVLQAKAKTTAKKSQAKVKASKTVAKVSKAAAKVSKTVKSAKAAIVKKTQAVKKSPVVKKVVKAAKKAVKKMAKKR